MARKYLKFGAKRVTGKIVDDVMKVDEEKKEEGKGQKDRKRFSKNGQSAKRDQNSSNLKARSHRAYYAA